MKKKTKKEMEMETLMEKVKKNLKSIDLKDWGNSPWCGRMKVNTTTGRVYVCWEGNWQTYTEDAEDEVSFARIGSGEGVNTVKGYLYLLSDVMEMKEREEKERQEVVED